MVRLRVLRARSDPLERHDDVEGFGQLGNHPVLLPPALQGSSEPLRHPFGLVVEEEITDLHAPPVDAEGRVDGETITPPGTGHTFDPNQVHRWDGTLLDEEVDAACRAPREDVGAGYNSGCGGLT
jgi:hypothetical protein